jgi:hypothetical protein
MPERNQHVLQQDERDGPPWLANPGRRTYRLLELRPKLNMPPGSPVCDGSYEGQQTSYDHQPHHETSLSRDRICSNDGYFTIATAQILLYVCGGRHS